MEDFWVYKIFFKTCKDIKLLFLIDVMAYLESNKSHSVFYSKLLYNFTSGLLTSGLLILGFSIFGEYFFTEPRTSLSKYSGRAD